MNTTEILQIITKLKQTKKKVHSNCFIPFQLHCDKEWEANASGQSLYIINRDHNVNRLLFYTTDFHDLGTLIQNKLSENSEYITEILTKDVSVYKDELASIGFQPFTRMKRMSQTDISSFLQNDCALQKYNNPAIGRKAELSDAYEINQKLWEIFDTRISHLQSLAELENSIRCEEIYIHKIDTIGIAAILQRHLEPKSFYINQIYNAAEKDIIHALLLKELTKYINNGGKYVYAWVEESNIASCKFHAKYGLKHDGLWDVMYKRELI